MPSSNCVTANSTSFLIAEQKRRGKKLSISDESPRKGRVESVAVPLTQ
jgi:hypothetical protein